MPPKDAYVTENDRLAAELSSARTQYQREVDARIDAESAAGRLASEVHRLHVDLVQMKDARDETLRSEAAAHDEAQSLTEQLAQAIARCDDHRGAREQVEQENNALRDRLRAIERERQATKDAVACWREAQKAGEDWRAAAESQHEDNDGLRREVLRLHQIIGQLYAQSL